MVGVAVVFGLYPFMFGPGQDEQVMRGLPQMVPTIAGFLPEDAEAIFARQGDSLQRLADADEVRLSFDGIQVLTDNPGVLPPDVEGLPVKALHPLRPSTIAGRPYKQALALFEQQKGILQRLPGVEEVRLGHEGIYVVTENQTGIPATVAGLPVKTMPPMRPLAIAARPYKDALAVYERNQAWLRELPDVEGVGIGAEGIHLLTENPGLIPPEVEGIPVQARPPMRRERIGGLPYEEAMAIYGRQKDKLQDLSGVEMVGINVDGIVINTDNPSALPKTVEGLPVRPQPPLGLKAQTPPSIQPQPQQDCGPYAHWVPEVGRCRLNSPSSDSLSASPPPKLLPPPPGVIILRPGGVREPADSCPKEFKEQVLHGWRFCLDPIRPETIPALMEPPIGDIPHEEALKILERHREELRQIPGVESVGLGVDGILIETTKPELLPPEVEGLPIKPQPPVAVKRLSHTQNTQIRPLHGGVAIRDFKVGVADGLTLTGVTLSQGVPWLVTSAHGLLDCRQNSPCPPGSTLSLNQCHDPQDYIVDPVSGQHAGTQRVVQPLSTAVQIVGFVQRWTPLNPEVNADDAAAAFMDNDTTLGNGSLRIDGKLEMYEGFTGSAASPVNTRPVTIVTQLPPHTIPGTVTSVSRDRSVPASCAGPQPIPSPNQVEFRVSTDDCLVPGDSGSPILDEFGNIIGMINYAFEGVGLCGGGGPLASTLKTTLGFDRWLGPSETMTAGMTNGSSFGIYRSGAATNNWVLDRGDGVVDSCGTGAYSDLCYTFGNASFLPITGKWSAGGPVKIGIHYNGPGSGSGAWYLDLNGDAAFTDCVVDICYALGAVDFVPVVGDWNGDGRSKIGVFYTGGGSGAGAWYIDYNGNGIFDGCGVDRCGIFGGPGFQGVAGDWNGDGKMEIGAFYAGTGPTDPNAGSWFLDLNGNYNFDGCGIDLCYLNAFGGPGDKAVVADWGGSGTGKIGVFRPSTVQWFLDRNGNGLFGGCADDRCFAFGQSGDLPISWNVAEVIGSQSYWLARAARSMADGSFTAFTLWLARYTHSMAEGSDPTP